MADQSQSSVNITNGNGPANRDNHHNRINGHNVQAIDAENTNQNNKKDEITENINNEVQSAMELLRQVDQDHSDIEESDTPENQPQTNGYHDQDGVENGSVENQPLEKEINIPQHDQDDGELNLDQANQLNRKERDELYQKGLR